MSTTHPLHKYEQEIEYFRSLVSIQSDPSRFNGIAAQLELRIGIIIQYIKKGGESASRQDLEYPFTLLRKYIALWQLYFLNHPWKPQSEK